MEYSKKYGLIINRKKDELTCIADSMSESGLSFVHPDNDLNSQANDIVSEWGDEKGFK